MHPETRLVTLIGILYMLMFTGRTVIIPILPPYARGLGASEATIGVIIGAFGMSRVIFDLPFGAIIQGYGARRVMFSSLMLVMVAALLAATTGSLAVLFAARFMEGAAMSLFFIAGLALVARVTKIERRGRSMSITSSMIEIGSLLGPALGGLVADIYGLAFPFYLYILLAAVGIPVVLWPLGRAEKAARPEAKMSLKTFKDLLLNRDLVTVNLATFALFIGRFGIFYTGVPLLAYDNLGVSKASLGGMLALSTLASFALLFPVGYLSDRYGRKIFMFSALALSAFAIPFMARAGDESSLMIGVIILGATMGLVGPTPAWFIDLAPANMKGGAMGMYRFFNDLGMTLGPIIVGSLIEVTRGSVVVPLPFDVVAVILFIMALVISRARDPLAEMRLRGKLAA